jgi:hypothetical protein
MSARTPPLPEWARKFRPPVNRTELGLEAAEADRSSIGVGLVATILVNLLLFAVPGALLESDRSILPASADNVELELVPPEEPPEVMLAPPEPENPAPRYVETNPTTPEGEPPPDTPNESDRNQRAANETAPEELSPDHSPAREGEDLPSNKIVPGEFEPPEPVAPPQPEGEPTPESSPSQPAERDPLPGEVEDQGESEDGPGTSVAPPTENPEPATERVEGARIESTDTRPFAPASPPSGAQRAQPAPRPRVALTTPGPVQRQVLGVSQTGSIEVDARFSEFGDYIARLVDAVSQHWHELCSANDFSERSTHVVIRFTLTRDGRIHNLTTVEKSSQSVGEYLSRTAIELGQPYGVWTDDMVRSLGAEEPIVLIFYYR